MALSDLLRPFGGTFLVFSDYMRGAVRLAAIMQTDVTFVWTHDSIGLGEDGPTHQPVEHLWALRAIPGLAVARPADANETAVVWHEILRRRRAHRPGAHPPEPPHRRPHRARVRRGCGTGGYVLADATGGAPRVLLLATGSEVQLALAAREALEADGVPDPGRVAALPRVVRGAGRRLPRVGAPAVGRPPASRSRPASPRAGGSTSAPTAAPCRSSTSGPRPTRPRCSASSASRRRPSCPRPGSRSPRRPDNSSPRHPRREARAARRH